MAQVRRFAMTGLTEAARKGGRRRGHLVIGAIDETGQEKAGEATAGVKRQYMGCAGRVANGINTVRLSYVREKTGHALTGARQWIPREHIDDPVRSLKTGLPLDLAFRTKGQLAIGICKDAAGDGVTFDFACADEVYGNCTELREFFEASGQAYVLRVPPDFTLTLASGVTATCAEAVSGLLTGKRAKDKRLWEVRSAGKGSKGDRWYAWAWPGTASPRHHLLIRRHLKTGDLAFCYCYVPEGQLVTKTRLIRAAGLRWPVEEDFEFGKDCFGLDQSQVRLYTAIARHLVLIMAALAICAVTAALLRDRTDTQAPEPVRPDQPPMAAALLARPMGPFFLGLFSHWIGHSPLVRPPWSCPSSAKQRCRSASYECVRRLCTQKRSFREGARNEHETKAKAWSAFAAGGVGGRSSCGIPSDFGRGLRICCQGSAAG